MELFELYDFADKKNIEIESFDLVCQPCLSIVNESGEYSIAIDPMQLESVADEKTKLAHELGHCVRGAFYNRYTKYDDMQRHEYRADKWAIKKLLPREELEAALRNNMELWELAELFEVTEDLVKKAMWIYFDKKIA